MDRRINHKNDTHVENCFNAKATRASYDGKSKQENTGAAGAGIQCGNPLVTFRALENDAVFASKVGQWLQCIFVTVIIIINSLKVVSMRKLLGQAN